MRAKARRLAGLGIAALLAAAPLAAAAADLTVTLSSGAKRPVADAVVTVEPLAGTPAGPARFSWPLVMSQQNLQFDPFVLIVPVGAEVAFPNRDTVRHHVYSFSPAKIFELKLYGREETRVVRFDKPGVVALGCNIHDGMSAFIVVVDTPYAGKSNAAGEAVIRNLPAGAARVTVWHPYLRAAAVVRTVQIGGEAAALAVGLDLRPPRVMHSMY